MMSGSCLIGVNDTLKFTDKNEINKMCITVNRAAPLAEWTFVSFPLGRGGIYCRNGLFCLMIASVLVLYCVGIRDELSRVI